MTTGRLAALVDGQHARQGEADLRGSFGASVSNALSGSLRTRQWAIVSVAATLGQRRTRGMHFNPTQALTVLLTTESLLFAVFALTLGFGGSSLPGTVVVGVARTIATAAALVLTTLGIGAATAWVDLFICSESLHGFAQWCPAVAIGVGVLSQPIFAWVFVVYLWRT